MFIKYRVSLALPLLGNLLLCAGCVALTSPRADLRRESIDLLQEQKAIPVPGDLSEDSVGKIVQTALANSRYWKVVGTPTPDTVVVEGSYKSLNEKASISWDDRSVRFVPRKPDKQFTVPYLFDWSQELRGSLLNSIRDNLARESNRLNELNLESRRTMNLEVLAMGDSIDSVKQKLSSSGKPIKEGAVKTPDGVEIGCHLITYDGHPRNIGSKHVTLIFFNRAYVAYMLQDKEDTELLVFDDYTHKLWEAKKISFRDYVEWKKRKWFEIRNVTPDAYDEELFLYQLWQAERVDMANSTLSEYRFLIKEKDRLITQLRANEALAKASARRAAAYQAETLSLQRQAVEQQRQAVAQQAIANVLTAFSATYRPTLRCTGSTTYHSFAAYSTATCQ